MKSTYLSDGFPTNGAVGKSTPIGVVDPDKLFREALEIILTSWQFDIAVECDRLDDLGAIEATEPNIRLLLLDTAAPPAEILLWLQRLRARHPALPVVVLTGSNSAEMLEACFAGGVQGYLMKTISPDALDQSLRLVMLGEKVYPAGLTEILLATRTGMPLNAPIPRQLQAPSRFLPRRQGQLEIQARGEYA